MRAFAQFGAARRLQQRQGMAHGLTAAVISLAERKLPRELALPLLLQGKTELPQLRGKLSVSGRHGVHRLSCCLRPLYHIPAAANTFFPHNRARLRLDYPSSFFTHP